MGEKETKGGRTVAKKRDLDVERQLLGKPEKRATVGRCVRVGQ